MGEWNDSFLFYGGAVLAGVSVIGGIIAFLISKIRWTVLNAQLDAEYGKIETLKHEKKKK